MWNIFGTVFLGICILWGLWMVTDIAFAILMGRKRSKANGHWDTVAWYHFQCPKCGSNPKEFCRMSPWTYITNQKRWGVRFNVHKERMTKAMLVLDGDHDNAYKGYKTDISEEEGTRTDLQ